MDDLVLELILDYQQTAIDFLGKVKNQLNVMNPVRSVIEKVIPREGHLKDGTRYEVHGIGIRFKTADDFEIVDIDIDSSGNYVGFDVWRLVSFSEGKSRYKNLTRTEIEEVVHRLIQKNQIQKQTEPMISHLYSWTPQKG